MFLTQRLKFRAIIEDISNTLVAMALDPRSYPGIASELRYLKSSASTPSLRSRESSVRPETPGGGGGGGGNVRVVVRVRAFLPRGRLCMMWNRNRRR